MALSALPVEVLQAEKISAGPRRTHNPTALDTLFPRGAMASIDDVNDGRSLLPDRTPANRMDPIDSAAITVQFVSDSNRCEDIGHGARSCDGRNQRTRVPDDRPALWITEPDPKWAVEFFEGGWQNCLQETHHLVHPKQAAPETTI